MPSDSITEIVTVRCPGPAQDDQRCTHGSTTSHGSSANGDWCYGPRRGPSVVTPPAQNEQRRNYCGHESTHAPHLNCCGYQVEFPFPAAPSVSTDHTDEESLLLYLSGPIKGLALPEAKARFIEAGLVLTRRGYRMVNPFDCEPRCLRGCGGADSDEHYDCFMRADLAAMLACDGVALLNGWERSRGARIEQSVAVLTGMDVRPVEQWPIARRALEASRG